MSKTKLKLFIVRHVFIVYIILSVLNLLLMREKWAVLGGLTAGTAYSIVKFILSEYAFRGLVVKKGHSISLGKLALSTGGSMLGVLILLAVSIKLSLWVFLGAAVGVLLVPIIIIINGITEALGISHNNFK